MQIPNLAIAIALDKTGILPFFRVTDVTPYGVGVANNITGILQITQPDGIVYTGDFTAPDIYYINGALLIAKKELRLANDSNFQKGTYTVKYTVRSNVYDETVIIQSFQINYTRPNAVLTPTVDVFTPLLKVNDTTDYVISDFSLQSVVRSWMADSIPGIIVGGDVTQFDLNINGQYFDSFYQVSMTAVMTYLLTAYSNISVIDKMNDSATVTTILPNSLNTLFAAITAFKNAITSDCTCKDDKNIRYMYAYVLFTNFLERGVCGDRFDLLKLYLELKATLNNDVSIPLVQTDTVIPTYNFGGFCGRGQSALPLLITSQPQSLTRVVGQSATFTVAASGTPTLRYQWRKNGTNIIGATNSSLTLSNVQNGDMANYDVVVSDGLNNSVNSITASLTVTTPAVTFTAKWGWFATDPYSQLHILDNLAYQGSGAVTTGQPIVADFRGAPNLQFLVVVEPATEPIKQLYANSPIISSNIPDSVWQTPFVFGGNRYYVTRQLVTFDSHFLTTLS